MKYYGEATKKLYNTVEECEKAEAEFKKQLEEAEAKKKELADAKAAEGKKITEAYKKVRAAQKEYETLRNDFIKKHGAFHFSFRDPEERFSTFFEDFLIF